MHFYNLNTKTRSMNNKLNIRAILAVTTIMILTFGACKKDKDNDENGPTLPASMSATINTIAEEDGLTIEESTEWSAFTRVSIMKGDVINITGTALNLTGINVIINGTKEETYELGLPNLKGHSGCGLVTTLPDGIATFISSSGQVTLTKVDKSAKLISGTFEFSLFYGSYLKTITNGKFENLKYKVQ